MGELAAGIGHEINNPLAISVGYLQKISRQLDVGQFDVKDVQETISKILVANERIAGIVSGLGSLIKKNNPNLNQISLGEVIDQTLSLIQEMYKFEGINLIYKKLKQDVIVLGSFGKIQQVLINILNNSRHELQGRPSPRIDLSIKSTEDYIYIYIKDNGEGIPHEYKDKIFDAFFTTKLEEKGTGLGLSVSKRIAREMQGDLCLREHEQEGACFEFKLKKGDPIEQTQDLDSSFGENQLGQFKILIVDDEVEILDLLTDMLSLLGQKVFAVSSAEEALSRVQQEKYDIIISDIKMPGINGISMLKEMLKLNLLHFPKFYFQTGGVDLDSLSKLVPEIKNSVSGIISKPYVENELRKMLLVKKK